MPTWPFEPLKDSEEQRAYEVETIQFGGRYAQRVPSGVNPSVKTWDLNFRLTEQQVGTARALLDGAGGYRSFLFADPSSGLMRDVVCQRWRVGPIRGTNRYILQATFEEVPAP